MTAAGQQYHLLETMLTVGGAFETLLVSALSGKLLCT